MDCEDAAVVPPAPPHPHPLLIADVEERAFGTVHLTAHCYETHVSRLRERGRARAGRASGKTPDLGVPGVLALSLSDQQGRYGGIGESGSQVLSAFDLAGAGAGVPVVGVSTSGSAVRGR
jgi:hypothetical protein